VLSTGQLVWSFFAALLMTVPVSLVLVAWYRHTVKKAMTQPSGAAEGTAPAANPAAVTAGAGQSKVDESRLRKRLLLIYGLAVVVSGGVLTVFWRRSNGVELTVTRTYILLWSYAWPLAAVLAALLAMIRRWAILIPLLYLAAGGLVVLSWTLTCRHLFGRTDVHPGAAFGAYGTVMASHALVPFAMILLTGQRKLRPVSPLAFAALLLFALANTYAHAAVRWILDSRILFAEIPPAITYSWLWPMLTALPAGYLCWQVLRWLGRRYQGKAFSDVQLVVDSWVFIGCFFMAPWTPDLLDQAAGVIAFAIYRVVVTIGLRAWRLVRTQSAPRLLMLRVFGYQSRTESIYDQVVQRWRLLGSVQLIGGADLAGRTLDPGQIITFVGGGLNAAFVRSGLDLQRKLEVLDHAADPDGRFRSNQLYCHADTWRPTLEALLARSDVVLMDLRGFSQLNQGCRFELEKIVESGLLAHTLFLIDDSTDRELLRTVLGPHDEGSLHVERVARNSSRELEGLFQSLRRLAVT
jgi:hypothetical protein